MSDLDMRTYYKQKLQHLETPEFVAWFEEWYGGEEPYGPEPSKLLDLYWSERRFALLGWFAAHLPFSVARNKAAFVRAMHQGLTREA